MKILILAICLLVGCPNQLLAVRDRPPRNNPFSMHIAAGAVTFQDRATSPLVYIGPNLDLGFAKGFYRDRWDMDLQFSLGLGYAFSNAPKQMLPVKSNSYFVNLNVGYTYYQKLRFLSSEKFSLAIGGKLDYLQDVRINNALQNAVLGREGFFSIMGSMKGRVTFSGTTKRHATPIDRFVFVKLNVGLLNFNNRPGYNYLPATPNVGDTQDSDYTKDQDGNRKVSMNGSRIQFEIGYGRRKFLGRETQYSYTFELASAPGRFEPYAVMFNRLKFTLLLNKDRR